MNLLLIFAILLFITTTTAIFTLAAGVPYINEQFSVNNIQIDDTLGGEIVVRQLIIQDPIARRSKMLADGKLVNGVLEQVIRCDGPQSPSGYIVQLTGPSLKDTQCLVENISETWNNFWSFPANASYQGKQPLPGDSDSQEYDCYVYWTGNEQWKLYLTQRRDETTGTLINVPIWSGKVFTPFPSHHLYHMHWVNFQAGPAPVEAFNVTGNTTNCQQVSDGVRRAAQNVHY